MSVQMSSLGRGLESLLPKPQENEQNEGPLFVNITRIHTPGHQPRRYFADDALRELARSISEQGILQPLVVSPRTEGGYTLIAGERRLCASKMAGMTDLPVVIRHVTEAEAYELALIENIQREDLNPLEEAEAYQRLIGEHGYTQEALAKRVGKGRPTVSNALRLLKLGPSIREKLLRGALSAGHARALLATDDLNYREQMSIRIEGEGLSVREVERQVANHQIIPNKSGKRLVLNSQAYNSMCSSLQSHLKRQVRIRTKRRGSGGTVVIAYKNDTDLRRLISDLT